MKTKTIKQQKQTKSAIRSKVAQMRKRFDLDRVFILRKMEETEDAYFFRHVDLGMEFAYFQTKRVFMGYEHLPFFQDEIDKLLYNKENNYWVWFLLEIRQIESELIRKVQTHPKYRSNSSSNELFQKMYWECVNSIHQNELLQKSFNNYYERWVK